jgi:ABC-type transport system involved in multi-copper enzyme maturation permease subunit
LVGAICYATAGELGLGPGLPNKSGLVLNPIARSTLMILILGTVFIGLSTAIQEIIKENPIRLREKSVGIRSGTYLMSKVLVLGVITTLQTMMFAAIVLFNRPLPEQGVFFSNAYLLIVSLLGLASMCLGLVISALLSSTEQAMPILVGLTMGQVVLSGALPGKNEGIMAMLAPLSPSYWTMNSLSSSINLIKISLNNDPDLMLRWEGTLSVLRQGTLSVAGMALIFLAACYIVLVKKR